MKTILALLAVSVLASHALASSGSGPWANGTYYPGNLDGKYQAAVSGQNVAGVLGFAITDGTAPFLASTAKSSSGSNSTVTSTLNVNTAANYYAIYVNGTAYTGTTYGSINYDSQTVAGVLQGSSPATNTFTNSYEILSQLLTNIATTTITNTNSIVQSQLVTNVTTTNTTTLVTNNGVVTETNTFYTNQSIQTILITNNLPVVVLVTNTNVQTLFTTNPITLSMLVATGVDGSFQANITGDGGVFTFQGPGELTAPGATWVAGESTASALAFTVNGIRVSFSSQISYQTNSAAGGQ